ncbi:MAG: hypothetical protein WD397_07485 [Wenzhouxiangellaceae bacterium]
MPEIVLELSLNRSSGVLAGVVASLSQAGIELKSQKLRRASEGRGGWLTVVGEGEAPTPSVLAERLNNTRGVDKLMRIVVDGEATLAEGKPLKDQMQTTDLAELSAAGGAESQSHEADTRKTSTRAPKQQTGGRTVAKKTAPGAGASPVHSEPGQARGQNADRNRQPGPAAGSAGSSTPNKQDLPPLLVDDEYDETGEPVAPTATPSRANPEQARENDGSAERELAEALGGEGHPESDSDRPIPEFAAEPSEEDDLADALLQNDDSSSAGAADPETSDEPDPDRVETTLRRRRRRRR